MPTNNDKITQIDAFPSDGVSRVVYRYGGFYRNENIDSTNPFIEVLVIEVNLLNQSQNRRTDQWLLLDKCATFLVPFLELDSIQIGSIWIGNTLSDKTYRFDEKLVTQKFTFDLSAISPRNVRLIDKIPNSQEFYMPLKNYFLPNPNNVNYEILGYPFSKYSKNSYQKVNYCLLTSTNNIQVFASANHILHSCFSNTKDIRELLINTSINQIINRFFEDYTIKIIKNDFEEYPEYTLKLRQPYKKAFGKISQIFLANLALNDHVQMIVKKLQKSFEAVDYLDHISGNSARYPIIFPPHPHNLNLTAEGIWLDDNKTRFAITRITVVNPIEDNKVHYIDDFDLSKSSTKSDKDPISIEQSREKNENINTQEPPSRVSGQHRKQSDVETEDVQGIIRYSSAEPETDPIEIDSKLYETIDKSEDVETSSDAQYGNDKTKPKKSETTDKENVRDSRFDLEYILQALTEIAQTEDSLLSKITSISASGENIEGYELLQIKKIVEEPKHPSWIDYDRGRKLLFLQLEFKNSNEYCYLIDIQKNKHHESFCVFLFLAQYKLGVEEIKQISIALEIAKGVKKWIFRCGEFIKIESSISIMHIYAAPSEWKKRFNTIFQNLIINNI